MQPSGLCMGLMLRLPECPPRQRLLLGSGDATRAGITGSKRVQRGTLCDTPSTLCSIPSTQSRVHQPFGAQALECLQAGPNQPDDSSAPPRLVPRPQWSTQPLGLGGPLCL
mmetsp:Transcript_149381/g.260927  ORF Transcript_149381/g.260927 Transcript_149381/m.260927 type:complete len:111 (-) Transcript_149381:735-1067(-)